MDIMESEEYFKLLVDVPGKAEDNVVVYVHEG